MTKFKLDPFSTDHLQADLKYRSVRGGAVTLVGQGVSFILQTGSVAVLARLLTPSDFGLVAMVTAITGFMAMFKDAGLSLATIQRERITHEQISMLFWVNVALSALIMFIVAASAPLIAWFYHEPRLVPLTLAFAGVFLLTGLSIQHRALLQRQMRFKALAIINITATVAGVTVAIVAAVFGLGYWALVVQVATSAVVNLTADWFICRWCPGRPRRATGVRSMLAFGGHLTGFNFINYFARNADNILIGWWWGSGPLGFYSKAYQLLMLPIMQINGPISAVAMPALSRLQHDPERFKKYFFKAIGSITFIGMPIVAFLFVEGHDVVLLVLGKQWLAAVPVFRALSVAAFMGTFNVSAGWVYMALGRTDRQFKWAFIGSPIIVGSFLVGLPWGVLGVAICYSVAMLIVAPLAVGYSFIGTFLRFKDFLSALALPASTSVTAALIVMLFNYSITDSSTPIWNRLTLASGVYFASYLCAWMLTPSSREQLMDFFMLLKNIKPNRPKAALRSI